MFSEREIGTAGSDLLQVPEPQESKVNLCSLLCAVDQEQAVGLDLLAALEVTDTTSRLLPGAPMFGEIVFHSKTCHVPTAVSRLFLESVL